MRTLIIIDDVPRVTRKVQGSEGSTVRSRRRGGERVRMYNRECTSVDEGVYSHSYS